MSYTRPMAERQVIVLGRLDYKLRNEISVFNVELIVAFVVAIAQVALHFSPQMYQAKREKLFLTLTSPFLI